MDICWSMSLCMLAITFLATLSALGKRKGMWLSGFLKHYSIGYVLGSNLILPIFTSVTFCMNSLKWLIKTPAGIAVYTVDLGSLQQCGLNLICCSHATCFSFYSRNSKCLAQSGRYIIRYGEQGCLWLQSTRHQCGYNYIHLLLYPPLCILVCSEPTYSMLPLLSKWWYIQRNCALIWP